MKKDEKILSVYEKVGRISMTVSKKAKIKSADIFIDKNHLKHVEQDHRKELLNLGLTAREFIFAIINSFTRIYKDTDRNSYYLAIYAEKYTNAAVIELNFVENFDFWEIKTAAPFRTAFFKHKLLVWERERTP